jgi:hypothetical protein
MQSQPLPRQRGTTDAAKMGIDGVSDGARTRDPRDHNPVLYQLSYAHHRQRRPENGTGQYVLPLVAARQV